MIKKSTREVDIFAKWSNDQYALLLPNVDFRAGQGAARKLQRIIADVKFAHVGQISCSFGITSLAPQDTIVSFRSRAESALATAGLRDIQSGAIETKLYVDLVGN